MLWLAATTIPPGAFETLHEFRRPIQPCITGKPGPPLLETIKVQIDEVLGPANYRKGCDAVAVCREMGMENSFKSRAVGIRQGSVAAMSCVRTSGDNPNMAAELGAGQDIAVDEVTMRGAQGGRRWASRGLGR
jgi:hypothetical protein